MQSEIAPVKTFNEAAQAKDWPIFCDASCTFDAPVLAGLCALWRAETAGAVPAREQFTHHKLQTVLRDIAFFERIGDGADRRFRVRLMGSGIAEHYGDLTGKYIDEVVPPRFLDRWHALADLTLQVLAPLRFLGRPDSFGKPHLLAEYFAAPLAASDGAVRIILLSAKFTAHQPWHQFLAAQYERLRHFRDDTAADDIPLAEGI